MARYEYQATNSEGEAVSGSVEAPTVSRAVMELEAKGLTIHSIGLATPASQATERPFARIPSSEDARRAVLQQHLRAALERGAPLVPALQALAAELPAGPRRRKLLAFLHIVERGDTAAAVKTFSALAPYWMPLLSAATVVDSSEVLSKSLRQWQDADKPGALPRVTLVYVLLILAAAAAVMVLLSVLVIPIYRSIFEGFGLRLRPLTQAVITVADWIASGRILIVLLMAAAVVVMCAFLVRQLPRGVRDWFGDRYGHLFGRWAPLAHFTRYSADLLEGGVPAAVAVPLAGTAAKSPRMARASLRLAAGLDTGQALRAVSTPVVPATVVHALSAEMPHLSRLRLLRELSKAYGERSLAHGSWTRGIIEPLGILFIGLIVGLVVIGLFLPFLSLIQALA